MKRKKYLINLGMQLKINYKALKKNVVITIDITSIFNAKIVKTK